MTDYVLGERDLEIVGAARGLLNKALQSGHLRPAEVVSVGKLLHVLACLPRATRDMDVAVGVAARPRSLPNGVRTCHSWDVRIEGDLLTISAGGYYNAPDTGTDSFTSLTWEATPGQEAELRDYVDRLGLVPDIEAMPAAIRRLDLSGGGFSIEVTDSDNELLDDYSDAPDPEEPAEAGDDGSWVVSPKTLEEERLAAIVRSEEVDAREPDYAYGAERCDVCGRVLDECGVFVDGQLRGESAWGNMCAVCFESRGEQVGWGSGQLYARQVNGAWRLVAGFPPVER